MPGRRSKKFRRNVLNYLPLDAASYPRKMSLRFPLRIGQSDRVSSGPTLAV